MKSLARFFLSGMGTGFFPFAPGTAGSLLGSGIVAIAVIFFPEKKGELALLFLIMGFLIGFLGIFLLSFLEKKENYDESWITLDEISGVWIASVPAFFAPNPFWGIVFAFLLFRFFDITKPMGIRQIDERKNKSSVFWDDIAAGGVSAVILSCGILVFSLG